MSKTSVHIAPNVTLEKLLSRDKAEFEKLYDNYAPALHGILLKILKSEEQAEDILQEIFITFYTKIEQYNPQKGRLFTWMINIARNRAIDFLRSRKNKSTEPIQPEIHFVGINDSSLMNQVDGIGLKEVIDKLSSEQKAVIDLIYFKGFTQGEASKELNIPLGTVKSRVRSALMALRKKLDL